jgi:hypothetical protein
MDTATHAVGFPPGLKSPPREVSAWEAPLKEVAREKEVLPPPPPLPMDPGPSMAPEESPRYCSYTDKDMEKWLSVSELKNHVILQLTGMDLYDSHTALRHAHELAESDYEIHVVSTMVLRKHKGFTPWFAGAKTKYRGYLTPKVKQEILELGSEVSNMENSKEPHCVLVFNHKPDPVLLFSPHIAAMNTALHYATFDIRIAGNCDGPA